MIVVANSNPIHKWIEAKCVSELGAVIINEEKDLTAGHLQTLSPDFIFFLHWSKTIPESVYGHFNCVVFHMTDLPYGRGGSPLQNLIVRGHEETVISAIKVDKGVDTGPVYLKRPLSLGGTAEEIFLKAGKVMYGMIGEIFAQKPIPKVQTGEPVVFKRRQPEESNIFSVDSLESLYDKIRMLDAEGYPHAYLESDHFRFEFTRASLKTGSIIADVRIVKK